MITSNFVKSIQGSHKCFFDATGRKACNECSIHYPLYSLNVLRMRYTACRSHYCAKQTLNLFGGCYARMGNKDLVSLLIFLVLLNINNAFLDIKEVSA